MQIETGIIVEGKITGITDFGAFVELDGGKTGMVHISEVALDFVKDIREHLEVGQQVKCKVISISPEGKISLSIRKALEETGEELPKPERKKQQRPAPKVWQGNKKPAPPADGKQSFEDMMAHFKQVSDDKMSDLKRADSKRGSVGYSRRGKN